MGDNKTKKQQRKSVRASETAIKSLENHRQFR